MTQIPEAAQRAAEVAYTEKLVELRIAEGGGFNVASQQRRAIASALEAAAPHMLADIAAELEDAPPANYEEDNYDAGYAAGLAFALNSLEAPSDPGSRGRGE